MADLAEIVIVNENGDEATADEVTVFRNAEAACGWLEHWWVENGQGSAYTASGERLTKPHPKAQPWFKTGFAPPPQFLKRGGSWRHRRHGKGSPAFVRSLRPFCRLKLSPEYVHQPTQHNQVANPMLPNIQ